MEIKESLYSNFKGAHHLKKIEALRRGGLVAPLQAQIDLTNACQRNCEYCFYRGANSHIVTEFDRKAELPLEVVEKLIREMVSLKIPAIQLTGGGEPLLYPDILYVLDLINRTELELALVTNGGLLDFDIVRRLTTALWIRVSIDAATPETYGKSQHCSPREFTKVLGNIQMAVHELPNTVIGASFIITPDNYTEIYEAAKLYKSIGVHNVRFSIAYTKDQVKLFEPFMQEMMDLTNQARELSDDNFIVFALNTDHMEHLGKKKSYKNCYYSHLVTVIEATGKVRPCCTMKALPHSCFGNIKEESFEDIWFGKVRKKWLEKFDSKSCALCWMDDKNIFLNYVMSNDPPHVNYI